MNDNGGLHYIDYDSDLIWKEMMMVYDMEGGDALWPGDEKEMLLRAVQLIAITILAKVDNALRMDTLTYAEREYLKEYGRKRNCEYIEAKPATASVTITMEQTGYSRTLPEGTLLTADGVVLWVTTEEIELTGYAQQITTTIQCNSPGIVGNGLREGTEMQFMEGLEGLVRAVIGADASGGVNAEDWEVYRERIRNFGLASVTTGPEMQYEGQAMAVTTEILDAQAMNDGPGEVGMYLITEEGSDWDVIATSVLQRLSAEDTRPLTDHVSVYPAAEKRYTLNVKVWYGANVKLTQSVAETIAEYQSWQDYKIGRAWNPDKLVAMLYQSGCERVQFTEGSEGIDGGEIEYTLIPERARCLGTITPTIINV